MTQARVEAIEGVLQGLHRTVETLAEGREVDAAQIAALRSGLDRVETIVHGPENPVSHERRLTRTEVRLDERGRPVEAAPPTFWERLIGAGAGALGTIDKQKRLVRTAFVAAVLGLLYWATFGGGVGHLLERAWAREERLLRLRLELADAEARARAPGAEININPPRPTPPEE